MIDILYAGNGKVFDGVLSSLLSVVMRTETNEPIRAFVFTMDITRIKPEYTAISRKSVEFLDRVLKDFNPLSEVVRVDVGELYEKELGGCPNETAYCSPYTLLRLLSDKALDINGKLLYLDADIMFNRDITLLYGTDVTRYEYAAARDHYGKFLIRPDYINAGVLLFNMKKCRETGIFEKARELMRKKKFLFADQDAVFYSTTSKLLLPQKFNDQKFLHKNTVVRHFSKRLFYFPYPHTDNIKQWQVEKVKKVFGYDRFDDVFAEYAKYKKIYEDPIK